MITLWNVSWLHPEIYNYNFPFNSERVNKVVMFCPLVSRKYLQHYVKQNNSEVGLMNSKVKSRLITVHINSCFRVELKYHTEISIWLI